MYDQFMHITQISGISTLSAILIISEIGVDMIKFQTCMMGRVDSNQ